MWRSRLRATFLSNRYEVDAGDEPTITHKPGYDIYRLLGAVVNIIQFPLTYLSDIFRFGQINPLPEDLKLS